MKTIACKKARSLQSAREKSSHWSKHGTHKPIIGWLCQQQRSRRNPEAKWCASVKEAFAAKEDV
jgi:hypothetical protein